MFTALCSLGGNCTDQKQCKDFILEKLNYFEIPLCFNLMGWMKGGN